MWARLQAMWERLGPRARDVVFVGIAALAAFADTMARRDEAAAEWTVVGAAAVVAAIALWWRRSHPVTVTFVGLGTVAVTGLPFIAFIALFTLAVRRRDRVLAAVTALTVVTFVVSWSLDTDDSWLRLVISVALVIGFFVATGAYVGARLDLVAALRERAERAEAEQEALAAQARLAERAGIAREMHDVLAHKVTLIAMHAGALGVQLAPTPEQVATSAELIRGIASEAMEDLRDVLGVLRADRPDLDVLAPTPRHEDIIRVVDASQAAGVHVELLMEVVALPDPIARAVHRVVVEGLTNVHKHARGAASTVHITGNEHDGVSIAIVNERPVGRSHLLPGSGVGLLGLRERIELLGGRLESGPRADGRWGLEVWIPWSHP